MSYKMMDDNKKSIFSIKSKTDVVLSKKNNEPYVFLILSEENHNGEVAAIVYVSRVLKKEDFNGFKCEFESMDSFKSFVLKLLEKFQKFDIDIFKYDGILDEETRNKYKEWIGYLI